MATLAGRLKALEDAFKAFKASGGAAVDYGPDITALQAQVGQIASLTSRMTAAEASITDHETRIDSVEARPTIYTSAADPAPVADGSGWIDW